MASLVLLLFILQEGKFGGGSGGGKKVEQTSHWSMSFFDRGPALAVTPDGKLTTFWCIPLFLKEINSLKRGWLKLYTSATNKHMLE